jgi:hypothetical protein
MIIRNNSHNSAEKNKMTDEKKEKYENRSETSNVS